MIDKLVYWEDIGNTIILWREADYEQDEIATIIISKNSKDYILEFGDGDVHTHRCQIDGKLTINEAEIEAEKIIYKYTVKRGRGLYRAYRNLADSLPHIDIFRKELEPEINLLENRIEGFWKIGNMGFYECSNCKRYDAAEYPYCPYCGAKMKKSGFGPIG